MVQCSCPYYLLAQRACKADSVFAQNEDISHQADCRLLIMLKIHAGRTPDKIFCYMTCLQIWLLLGAFFFWPLKTKSSQNDMVWHILNAAIKHKICGKFFIDEASIFNINVCPIILGKLLFSKMQIITKYVKIFQHFKP